METYPNVERQAQLFELLLQLVAASDMQSTLGDLRLIAAKPPEGSPLASD